MKREFFLILLEKRTKLLAHLWSSGCLATGYAIEKLLLKIFFSSIENDHLGDWSPEKDFWWRLTFRQPVWKPSSESSRQFSVTMASRFKIVDEEYVGELKDEKKWKHEEKDRVLEERFQKVGEWKKLPSKFRRVRLTAISSTKHCRSFIHSEI